MLQFINRNLICNAIKYSPSAGRITIDISQENNYWIVAVSDQGKGLDTKKRETLFSVGNLSGSTNEGAGIALSMCKDFITKLGGEINKTMLMAGQLSIILYLLNNPLMNNFPYSVTPFSIKPTKKAFHF